MRASVLTRPGSLALVDLEDPPCAEEEIVIRVANCGVCGTDRSIFRGEHPARVPVVLGHEYSGVVVAMGAAVSGLALGDRVAVDPNVVDGTCAFCRRGESHLSPRHLRHWGYLPARRLCGAVGAAGGKRLQTA